MTIYREKLSPSWAIMLACALFLPAGILLGFPLGWWTGALIGVALTGASIGFLWWVSPTIVVTDRQFRAGRAVIDISDLGAATAYTGAAAVQARGPGLDARAWLVIRPWVSPVVRIDITDPDDPTPYWLVSTRRPDELVQVFEQSR